MNSFISFAPGSVLVHAERECVVLDLSDLESVIVRYADDGQITTVSCSQLSSVQDVGIAAPSERTQRLVSEVLPLISDKRWKQARLRLIAMRDLLRMSPFQRGLTKVNEAAKQIGRSPATVYRLLADFDRTQSIRVFLRLPRSDKGQKKIAPKVDRLIRAVVKKEYLTDQRKMVSTVAEAVNTRCRRKKWVAPHKSTVARRINELLPRTVVKAREGRKAARGRHDLARGEHPEIKHLNDLWQLDHTPSDYCIVDEVLRRPLDGAQTLSVALDIATRCVVGFTLFMEAPSVRVAGACMAFSILPKERFLQEMEVDANWPCHGLPSVIYTDNASEFEAKYFLMACEVNGIEPRKRPKGAPNFAGHIESLFRTFLQKVHELEGSRFSNWVKRLEYDSTGRAIMTIEEFRRWFTIFITKYYHQKPHSGLAELPPIKAWENGVRGTDEQPGVGLPDRVADEFKLRLDFLPGTERTIQDYGISIERLKYSDTVLRRWVGARDPESLTKRRKFIVKYDPFDMSEVYFLDPDLKRYFAIPVVGELDHITLWENSTLNRKQRKENRAKVDQQTIEEGLQEMRDQTQISALRTKKARRAQQRVIDSKRQSVSSQRRANMSKPANPPDHIADDFDDDFISPMPGAVVARPDQD